MSKESDISSISRDSIEKCSTAAKKSVLIPESVINKTLVDLSKALVESSDIIITANIDDLSRMSIEDPKYDRLMLSKERIADIANDLVNVSKLPYPIGKTLLSNTLDNGLKITRVSVPFGVIGTIFESRPNVTIDIFSLCLKSGNGSVLKGSRDAKETNIVLVNLIKKVLSINSIDSDIVTLLPVDREATDALLNAVGLVDLIIPRGSKGLIDFVRKSAKIPVIETGAGICHTYFDEYADTDKGRDIIFNAKTRRVSVCNAMDTLVIHSSRLSDLPSLMRDMSSKEVEIFADPKSFKVLESNYPSNLLLEADEDSFGTEFLSHKLSIKCVDTIEEAIDRIGEYSSKHSEAIVSENRERCSMFTLMVDAAAVYTNSSTAFTDGAQFGLGAEVGISTQKLHARGPMGLEELTSYKWVIEGEGQTRDS